MKAVRYRSNDKYTDKELKLLAALDGIKDMFHTLDNEYWANITMQFQNNLAEYFETIETPVEIVDITKLRRYEKIMDRVQRMRDERRKNKAA